MLFLSFSFFVRPSVLAAAGAAVAVVCLLYSLYFFFHSDIMMIIIIIVSCDLFATDLFAHFTRVFRVYVCVSIGTARCTEYVAAADTNNMVM